MAEVRIFITSLPKEATKEIMGDIFQKQTGVAAKAIAVLRNNCLLDLPDDVPREKAKELLHGYEVMGSHILVEPNLNQDRNIKEGTIRINGIPDTYNWDDFTRLVSSIGTFQHCEKGPSRNNSYYAVITYETEEVAQKAQYNLNNYEIKPGIHLKVEYLMDFNRSARNGGGRGGSRSYRNYNYNSPRMFRSNDFPLRILVLSDMVGAIIGRAGNTIRQITQQSRARVDVHRKENAGSPEKVITIYGSPESCTQACQKIMDIMQQEASSTNRGEIPLKLLAHNNLIGRIIGKNGSTIKRIMEQSDTKIAVSSNIHDFNSFNLERIITVKGSVEGMAIAEKLLSLKLRQSYENDLAVMASQNYVYPSPVHPMAMMMPHPMHTPPRASPPASPYGMYSPNCMPMGGMGYPQNSIPPPMEASKETTYVYIPSSSVGAIIGTGGSSIRDMISTSGATIKVTQPEKDDPAEKSAERKVCVVGCPEAQWKAQLMIFKKIAFEGYQGLRDATLKVEILIPTQQVGRVIGKGGSTVRELQRLTHTLIKFPEDGRCPETDETTVHIIGDFFGAMAAQRQIRSLVIRSNFPRRRMSQASVQNLQN